MDCPWRRICLLHGLQETVQNRCLRTAIFDAGWLLANRGGVEIERTFIADRFSPSRTGGPQPTCAQDGPCTWSDGSPILPQRFLRVSSLIASNSLPPSMRIALHGRSNGRNLPVTLIHARRALTP